MARITSVAAFGPAAPVYDWQSAHCASGRLLAPCHPSPCQQLPYRRDVPDAPAMAWRDPVSNLTFMAPGDSRGTWPSVGPNLDSVKHDCSLMIFNYSGPSGFLKPAAEFSNHEWLYAPYVLPPTSESGNSTLFMLVHNEFHGWEHSPVLCNATSMVDGRCWYNSVSLSVSHDGGRTIRHAAPPPRHLVAASSEVYAPNHGPYGVFSPSQIVKHPRDGHLYSFPRCRSKDGATDGVCLMRTTEAALPDPSSWRFWQGGGAEAFTGTFADPYIQRGLTEPAVLRFGNESSSPSQPVPRYLPKLDLFLLAGYCDMPGAPARAHFGVSYAPEPWGPWSRMQPITAVSVDPTKDEPFIRGLYPSLLDPNSASYNYDTIEGDEAYLYWVQGRNKEVVHAPDMARDLWRQKVKFTFGAGKSAEESSLHAGSQPHPARASLAGWLGSFGR